MINKLLSTTVLASVLLATASTAFAVTPYASQTSATISMTSRDDLIVATSVVNWDPKASDSLVIKWTAPKGSFCSNSSFSLTRGNNTHHDVSWAYRRVIRTDSRGGNLVCSGPWTAAVVDTSTGKTLATTGYTVTNSGAPAAKTAS